MEKKKVYNIYSDESCHLQNDNMSVMCLGYTKIEANNYSEVFSASGEVIKFCAF